MKLIRICLGIALFSPFWFPNNEIKAHACSNLETLIQTKEITVSDPLQYAINEAEQYLLHSQGADRTTLENAVAAAKALNADSPQTELDAALETLEQAIHDYVLQAEPTDGTAFDMTFLIRNPELTESAEGWSETATVDYGEAEIYNRTFNFYQTLRNMRSGIYRLNVTGFHRNGSYTPGIEEEGNAGCAIYGNNMKQPLLTLYYDENAKQFTQTGGYANNMNEASQIFKQGFYASNEVIFEQIEDGDMVIGLQNANSRNSNWTCFKNFTLEYLGKNTGGCYIGMFRIASPTLENGTWTPGALVNENTPIFHSDKLPKGKAGYWIMREEGKKQYSLRNAENGLYITWDGQYVNEDYTRRYVDLTETMHNDSSLWTIEIQNNGTCVIRNVHYPDHLFDLRSPSHVIGTYSQLNQAGSNQIFTFYTATQEKVTNFTGKSFRDIVKNLTFNGRVPAYDKSDNSFMIALPEKHFLDDTTPVEIGFTLADGYKTLLINDEPVENGSAYTFGKLTSQRYTLKVQDNEGEFTEAGLIFTALPVVQIYGSFNDDYSEGSIRVSEPDVEGADTLIQAKIRWRGASTRYRMKKQYAIKLYDNDGESKDASFFGLRDDNNWILDGMSIDKARMRNRVVTDLWNHMATKPYYFDDEPEAKAGTRGHFVEAFLNDEYVGIYCMTEKMDRKQMKLKKIDEDTPEAPIRGELWKSSDWSYSVFMGHNYDNNEYPMTPPMAFDNTSETWDGYEVKHPDLEDGEPVDWQDLYDAVNFVATASDDDFKAHAAEYFDIPVLIDYYILMETILSADNHGKNMYFGIYNRKKNKKITFAVWHLDSTCGRRWDSSEIKPSQDYTEYITVNEHGDYNLFRRMKMLNVDAFNERVKARYTELRKTALHTDSIVKRFTDYKDMFELAGATTREENRWTNTDAGALNFNDEMTYLRNWFTERMAFVDNQLLVTSVKTPAASDNLKVYGAEQTIIIESNTPAHITLHSISGTVLNTFDINPGVTRLNGLAKGIYLINGHKAIIR